MDRNMLIEQNVGGEEGCAVISEDASGFQLEACPARRR